LLLPHLFLFVLSLVNMVALSIPLRCVTVGVEILETGGSGNDKNFGCELRSWGTDSMM
jgi:hypothetical protein